MWRGSEQVCGNGIGCSRVLTEICFRFGYGLTSAKIYEESEMEPCVDTRGIRHQTPESNVFPQGVPR